MWLLTNGVGQIIRIRFHPLHLGDGASDLVLEKMCPFGKYLITGHIPVIKVALEIVPQPN